ncbi:MAG: alpha-ketoglutarate-dependent dioxygenase AlkB [Rhizonema sp. NSF051]|nr:alpha-ketoglutarate-dependent dioxygenase AlkB [Rhizonema sp. NSF051]
MQQLSLFTKIDAPVQYIPSFLSKEDADSLLLHCLQLEWQQNQIKMLGKLLQVPRLETIYGDEGCDYLYSKSVLLTPRPWTAALDFLRQNIEHVTGYRFNIVIGNLYRDGSDSIGWHSDADYQWESNRQSLPCHWGQSGSSRSVPMIRSTLIIFG